MHADEVAAAYGFRGGLVPGVTVYGYMTQRLPIEWRERGGMKLRLLQPFYDGDVVCIEASGERVEAKREDGTLCAAGDLTWPDDPLPALDDYPIAALPVKRPGASADSLAAGTVLGTLRARLESGEPKRLLELANHVLMANVVLKPWIHAGSDLRNCGLVEAGAEVEVRGKVAELYERKGHRFAALDLALGVEGRLVQLVRHVAIWEPRMAG